MNGLINVSDEFMGLIKKHDSKLFNIINVLKEIDANLQKIVTLVREYDIDSKDPEKKTELMSILDNIFDLLKKTHRKNFRKMTNYLNELYLSEDIWNLAKRKSPLKDDDSLWHTRSEIIKSFKNEEQMLESLFYDISGPLIALEKSIGNIKKSNPEDVGTILHKFSNVIMEYLLYKDKVNSYINETHLKLMQIQKTDLLINEQAIDAKKKVLTDNDFYANDNIYYHDTEIKSLSKILKFGIVNIKLLKRASIAFHQATGRTDMDSDISGQYCHSLYGNIKYNISILENINNTKEKIILLFDPNYSIKGISWPQPFPNSAYKKYKIRPDYKGDTGYFLRKLERDKLKKLIDFQYEILALLKQNALSVHRVWGSFDWYLGNSSHMISIVFEEESLPGYIQMGTHCVFYKRIKPRQIRAVLASHQVTTSDEFTYIIRVCQQYAIPFYTVKYCGMYGQNIIFNLQWPL